MKGITFGDKHSYTDLGLILSKSEIGSPEPKTYEINVPYRDGTIDVTEKATGQVSYKNRKLKFTFTCIDPVNTWSAKYSELLNLLNGKKLHIILDDDAAFYYVARLEVDKWKSNKNIGTIVVEGTAEPYKYDILTSAVDWEWDSFDFENGIINETGELVVSNETSVTLICRKKLMFPVFTVSAAMTLAYNNETFNLKAGSQKIFDLFLTEGENVLKFTGNGTVSIDYTGGSL